MIRFGSLCSGIEAASFAFLPLGWKAEWFSEIEPFPCALLTHHYPHVPNHGNMLDIPRLQRTGIVRVVDVLCGGTPCQAFSVAGKRESLDDDRGNLSLTFCEIADENDLQRSAAGLLPAVIVWENVPGVLSTKDNAFGCFLGKLAGEDCPLIAPGNKWPNAGVVVGPKRAIAWRVFDAQYFGVAQRRRRVFVVASAREGFDPTEVLFEFDGLRRDTPPSREARQEVAVTLSSRTTGGGGLGTDFECTGGLQPVAYGYGATCKETDAARALHAHPGGSRLDFETETFIVQPVAGSLQANGKAAGSATQQDAESGLLVPIAFSSKDHGGDTEVDLSPTLRAGGHHGSHANAGVPPAIAFDSRQDPVSSTEVFGALGSSSPQAQSVAYAIQAGALRTNPESGPDGVGIQKSIAYTLEARAEVQAVAVLPFDTTQVTSATNRSQPKYGDPSHPLAAGAHAPAVCITGEVTNTLKAEGFDASEDGTGRGQPIVAAFQSSQSGVRLSDTHATLDANNGPRRHNGALVGMAVRRLTPRECERLQGFPDDYTLITVRGKPAADGPRYKALGNSWAVTNVRWIGRRIDAELKALEALC